MKGKEIGENGIKTGFVGPAILEHFPSFHTQGPGKDNEEGGNEITTSLRRESVVGWNTGLPGSIKKLLFNPTKRVETGDGERKKDQTQAKNRNAGASEKRKVEGPTWVFDWIWEGPTSKKNSSQTQSEGARKQRQGKEGTTSEKFAIKGKVSYRVR